MKTQILCQIQQDAATGNRIYTTLSENVKNENNSELLGQLAALSKGLNMKIQSLTGKISVYQKIRAWLIFMVAKIMGLTFTLGLFEKRISKKIDSLKNNHPELHEEINAYTISKKKKLSSFKEEVLNHMGSVVLGLNDALVELSGALAGFTFALQNSLLIGVIGIITGFAATLSMATSEFLSQRHEGKDVKEAIKSCMYTGFAYLFTVTLLVLPYFFIANPFVALVLMMLAVFFIIFIFNYYNAVTTGKSFKRSFIEMAVISTTVALLSFGVGFLIDSFFTFEI